MNGIFLIICFIGPIFFLICPETYLFTENTFPPGAFFPGKERSEMICQSMKCRHNPFPVFNDSEMHFFEFSGEGCIFLQACCDLLFPDFITKVDLKFTGINSIDGCVLTVNLSIFPSGRVNAAGIIHDQSEIHEPGKMASHLSYSCLYPFHMK